MRNFLMTVSVAAAIAGCSGNEQEPTGVIPPMQKEAMEKARGVEELLKKQEEETRLLSLGSNRSE